MSKASDKRLAKVRNLILRTLDEIIRDELKDPRLGMFSLTDVTLSRDLSYAEVKVSALGEAQSVAACCAVLESAAPLLWNRLRSLTDLRAVPKLHFVADRGMQYIDEITRLIATLPKPADGGDSGSPPEEE